MLSDEVLDQRIVYYDVLSLELELKNSCWSIYEVENPFLPTEFDVVEKFIYKDHWGKGPVEIPLVPAVFFPSWIELWKLADKAIELSGDGHHIFIEDFKYVPEERAVYLSTGS